MNLNDIGWIIASIVLVLVILSYVILFSYIVSYKRRLIANKLMDDKIQKTLNKDINKYQKGKEDKSIESYKEHYYKKKKSKKVGNIFSDILLGFLSLILLGMLACSLYIKFNDNKVTFGDSTYVVVQDNSMSSVYQSNSYLTDKSNNNEYLNTRIDQYSLISLNKYDSSDTIKLYDIVAYEYQDNIIVHRVIGITQLDSKTNVYTLRGDALNDSYSYELAVTDSMIIGVYDGFNNSYLGCYIVFLQSYTGIIVISLFVLLIIIYDVTTSKLEKTTTIRYEQLLEEIKDESNKEENIEDEEIINEEIIAENTNVEEDKIENNPITESEETNSIDQTNVKPSPFKETTIEFTKQSYIKGVKKN